MSSSTQTQLKTSLNRYLDAQKDIYDSALAELRRGKKKGHWMWFIFPQIKGLGTSFDSEYFGIKDFEEAKKYLADPTLGKRLIECSNIMLSINGLSAEEILGHPDVLKLKSSMTLFERVSLGESIFSQVLDKYYCGQRDNETLKLLEHD